MPTFSALCFRPRNAQITDGIAEWFPAALWLDLDLQPFLARFLTPRCSRSQKQANPRPWNCDRFLSVAR